MKCFILLLLFLMFTPITAQNTLDTLKVRIYQGVDVNNIHQYDAADLFPIDKVSEDYGPRSTNEFHGGIDFNNPGGGDSDLHDLLLGIEDTATLVMENGVVQNNWSKWITLKGEHYYRYIHIFESEEFALESEYNYGGCKIKFKEGATNINEDWVIIF